MTNLATPTIRLGIISALQQEQTGLIDLISDAQLIHRGMRGYTTGTLWGVDCVCVLSRIGKVAAAATAAILIERFGVTHIIVTGVAGAADAMVAVGDIVIAQELVQHDLDCSPLFPRFEIPLCAVARLPTDARLTAQVMQAADHWFAHEFDAVIGSADRASFQLEKPRIHRGLIASGDEFMDDRHRLAQLKTALPDLLAVEMEGAAVAQVCFEYGIGCAVIRVISDAANEDAPVDFMHFIDRIAARYTFHILRQFCGIQCKRGDGG